MNLVIYLWLKSGIVRELESEKPRDSQGILLKKIGQKPRRNVTQFCRIRSRKRLFAKSKMTNLKNSGGAGSSEKYTYQNPFCLEFFWYIWPILRKGGRECLACPSPGYQDQGYLALFSLDLLYSLFSEKSTNWVMLPILGNFTNLVKICCLIWRIKRIC